MVTFHALTTTTKHNTCWRVGDRRVANAEVSLCEKACALPRSADSERGDLRQVETRRKEARSARAISAIAEWRVRRSVAIRANGRHGFEPRSGRRCAAMRTPSGGRLRRSEDVWRLTTRTGPLSRD
jgi:hypothetical protein